MENPNFLKQKYNLHNAPEVEKAAKRTQVRNRLRNKDKATGGQVDAKISQKPEARIQNYLDRFNEIIERKDPEKRQRGIDALKRLLYSKFVIKSEETPQSYFNLQGEIAVREGRKQDLIKNGVEIKIEKIKDKEGQEKEITNYIFPEEIRQKSAEIIISNQQRSLEKWVDYLSSDDAQYPDWAKYWAFRSMLEMGKYEKKEEKDGREVARFKKRTKDTVASFPLLNPRALAMTIGAVRSGIEEKQKPKEKRKEPENISKKLDNKAFQTLLSTENFSKIYTQLLLEMPEYSVEGLREIRGEWKIYPQGSEPDELVKSLEGYPLEWCTADPDTARTQLEGGDFHVYYSINENGDPVIPRLAIRMEGNRIAEPPRGIAPDQNLDPFINLAKKDKNGEIIEKGVLDKKLDEFGEEGEKFKKRAKNMNRVSEIEEINKNKQNLTKDELIFLYEIDSPIEGFGYQKDLRIDEIRKSRNPKEDAPIVFECQPEEIAYNQEDISENTKAYIGEWSVEVFQTIRNYPNIAHLFESFPDKKIFMETLETDPDINSPKKCEETLKTKNIYLTDLARNILGKTEFSQKKEKYELVRFTVEQLGLSNGATTDQIYKRAEELGLELCPAEVGPHLRLKNSTKEWMLIAMKQISDRDGYPRVFSLRWYCRQPELNAGNARPSSGWSPDLKFVFRARKLNT